MSGTAARNRRKDDGPRAGVRDLVPYLAEHRGVLVVVGALSIVGAAATLAQPLLVGQLITRVQDAEPLGALVWLLVALVIVASVLSGYQHYLLQRTGTAVVYSSRRRLVGRILHLPIAQFDARRTGDLVSRVSTDTTLLYAVLTQGLADAVGNALLFVGAIVAMAVIDPLLLGLIVVVLGVSIGIVVTLSSRIRVATREQQERLGDLSAGVERAIGSIRTIRAAGAGEREQAAVTSLAEAVYREGIRVARISALVVPVAGIALQVSLLVVLGVGGLRVAAGALTIAGLVTFVMFLFLLIAPLASFFGAITSTGQALGALGRIQEVLDLPEEQASDAPGTPPPGHPDAPALEFRDVRFGYPDPVVAARRTAESEARALLESAHVAVRTPQIPSSRGAGAADDATGTADLRSSAAQASAGTAPAADVEVLRGVSFAVPRGSRVALVGPSGAGKSTALALIERFYDVTAGVVLVDGVDVRELDRRDLRRRLGYVEQDAPTLAGTLAENLRLAAPEATDADCIRVLREVNLGDVLDRSPLGLDAPVGEAGVMLSGGERQRLAIARALLAAPPILLLDESTSSLDGLNEERMRAAIETVAAGRTLVVIAHRLSTVVDSDLIVVLDRGEVVGQGTHAELVASTPLYRELARHQLLV